MTSGFYSRNGQRSTDGLTWTAGIGPTTNSPVCFSPQLDLFVGIAGTSGTVYTSTDQGSSWTNQGVLLWQPAGVIGGVSSTGAWREIEWFPEAGKFIAVGDYGSRAESVDGLVWEDDSGNDDYHWVQISLSSDGLHGSRHASYQGNLFGTSEFTSDGGLTWTTPPSKSFRTAAWSPELQLWAGVYGDTFGLAYIETSPDAETWTLRVSRSSVCQRIIWADGKFVAVGDDTGNNPNEHIAYSTDGVTWNFLTLSNGGATVNYVAYSPSLDLFAAVGNTSRHTSTDGVTWTARGALSLGSQIWWIDTNRPPSVSAVTASRSGTDVTVGFTYADADSDPQAAFQVQWRDEDTLNWDLVEVSGTGTSTVVDTSRVGPANILVRVRVSDGMYWSSWSDVVETDPWVYGSEVVSGTASGTIDASAWTSDDHEVQVATTDGMDWSPWSASDIVIGLQVESGSGALSGSGSLTAGGKPGFARSGVLSGSGTLTVPTRVPKLIRTVPLTGSGTLTVPARTVGVSRTAALTGVGVLGSTGQRLYAGSLSGFATTVSGPQWVNPTNAEGADDGSYATWTSSAPISTSPALTANFGTWAALPGDAQVQKVVVRIKGFSSHE